MQAHFLFREFTHNTAILKLFPWLGNSVTACTYLVIKESNHEKEIYRNSGFIASTADDTTLNTGRKKKNIATAGDGASNTYLEIYCRE